MKFDREALVSPKLLAAGGVLLLCFGLVVWLYLNTHSVASDIIDLLQQPPGSQDGSRLNELMAQRDAGHRILMITMGIFMLLVMAVSIAVSQSIIGPLRRTIEYADGIAKGRLGERASYWASGEVANVRDAVSDMQEQLTGVVVEVSDAAHRVDAGTANIEQSSVALHRHFDEQAHSLERVTGKMKSIAGSMRTKAEESLKIDGLVRETHVSIKSGGEIVKQTVAAMAEIHDSSAEIKDIVGIIDEIAFQTNLLALNAAVEAARSGEHGRGFAVVANEVRNLAQRSAEAASQIKTLIEDSVAKVQEGSRLASASGDTLAEILTRFDQVTECVSKLTRQTEKDATEVDAIITDVNDVERVMSAGQTLIESVGASSQGLKQSSSYLNSIVGYFKVSNDAAAHSAGLAPAQRVVSAPLEDRPARQPPNRQHQRVA